MTSEESWESSVVVVVVVVVVFLWVRRLLGFFDLASSFRSMTATIPRIPSIITRHLENLEHLSSPEAQPQALEGKIGVENGFGT